MSEHPNGAGDWLRSLFGKKEKDDSYYNRRPASGFSGVRSREAAPSETPEVPLSDTPAVSEPVPEAAPEETVPAPAPAEAPEEVSAEPAAPADAPEAVPAEPAAPAPEVPDEGPSAAQISLDLPEDVVGENWPREVASVARDPQEWETEEENAPAPAPSEGQTVLPIEEEAPAAPAAAPEEPAPLTTQELESPRAPIPSGMSARTPQSPRDLPKEANEEDFEEPEEGSFTEEKPRHSRAAGCLAVILVLLLLICGGGYAAYRLYPDETVALYHKYIEPLPTPEATPVPALPTPEPVLTKDAYLVSWGEVPLGTVEDAEPILEAYAKWRASNESAAQMELSYPGRLSAEPVSVEYGYQFADPDAILNEARDRTNRTYNGCVVMIEGHDLFAMAAPEKFRSVLETILEDAKASALKSLATDEDPDPEMPPCEWNFTETMRVERRMVSARDILTESEAMERLQAKTSTAQTTYTVQSGDTLAKIAARFHTTQEALMEANPHLESPDVIKVGEELNLRGETQVLNLTLSFTVTEIKVIPYTSEKVNDGDLAKGKTEVAQAGQDGQQTIVSRDSFLNGQFISHKVLSETTDKEMVPEIIHVGTYVKDTGSNPGGRKFPYPVSGYRISSYFGYRESTKSYHYGIDLAVPIGTPIYAADSGTVAFSGNASGYGLVVYLNHSGGYQTRYGHCSKLVVKAGDSVRKGQIIAYSGNTGRSTGPHCHFEIRVNGKAVNPTKYQ